VNSSERAESGERMNTSERPAEASGEERPELVSKPLGRFRPKKPMTGRWVGILALGLDVSSMVLHETVGPIPAIVLAAAGICVGKRGLDSKGRGFATIALITGIALFLFYTIMIIVGEEGFTPPPSSGPFG
jgi:hypothetical protein